MKIVVDINHPAHVHFFKNFIWEMEKRGHQVVITASKKDLAYTLLQKYGFTYIPVGSYGNSLLKKMINLPLLDLKMYNVLRKINPDILIGIGSIRAAHVSFLLKKPCISFEDTEHARGQIRLYLPFAATVCTPSCYRDDLGPKQIRYHGYHELAYLHPSRFTPNPSVLAELGLAEGDPYIIVRFVSWQASHDIGQHGIHDKVGLVKMLEKYGRVLITSEGALPEELQAYQIRISPEKCMICCTMQRCMWEKAPQWHRNVRFWELTRSMLIHWIWGISLKKMKNIILLLILLRGFVQMKPFSLRLKIFLKMVI